MKHWILSSLIPGNVEIYLLKEYLLKKFPGILALHEFHTWTFTPGTLVLTGHIMYQDKMVYMDINKQVENFLKSQGFSIVTIQPEFPTSSYPSDKELSTCNFKCKVRQVIILHIIHSRYLYQLFVRVKSHLWNWMIKRNIFQHVECEKRTCCKLEVSIYFILLSIIF